MATIHGTNGNDTIYNPWGLMGNDTIYGHDGDDTIYADSGDDLIYGGAGADDLYGQAGNDTASYTDSSARVFVSLTTGLGSGGTAEGDTLHSIENLTGSAYADVLVGNGGDNVLRGWYGDDILYGMDGYDRLYGSDGNDTLFGMDDADDLYGGAGNDTIYGGAGGGADWLFGDSGNDTLEGGADGDLISGGDGVDTASYEGSDAGVAVLLYTDSAAGGDAEGDELDGIENLTGSAYDDDLWGDDANNFLDGRNGNDSLKGFGGSDLIEGGFGNDTLWGMDGDDVLNGGNGNDSLRGGMDRDFLWGSSGADTFVWATTGETGLTIATADSIADFNRAEGDLISLNLVDANVYAAGNQAFTFIGTAAFSGTPGEVRYYQAGGDTYIELQTGTSADVEGVIRLAGIHTPDASWFVL